MDHKKPQRLKTFVFMCRNFFIICAALLNYVFVTPTLAHDYKAFPPSEVVLPESLISFRHNLEAALDTRDEAGIRSFLAEDIKFGFGGSYGPDEFIAELGLNESNGEGWDLLTYLILTDAAKINIGQTEAYILPYTSETWPENDDPFSIVVGSSETQLRALPEEDGRIVSTLKYPILHIISEVGDGEWLEVEVSNGLWGYIPEWETASFLGYRMLIENRSENGHAKWQISFVGAGD